ncbi:hypothetical protein KC338_g58 [Hortaea werneckii]|nr:hypothetical protein KC338_g58 [Hortaea werneckii]
MLLSSFTLASRSRSRVSIVAISLHWSSDLREAEAEAGILESCSGLSAALSTEETQLKALEFLDSSREIRVPSLDNSAENSPLTSTQPIIVSGLGLRWTIDRLEVWWCLKTIEYVGFAVNLHDKIERILSPTIFRAPLIGTSHNAPSIVFKPGGRSMWYKDEQLPCSASSLGRLLRPMGKPAGAGTMDWADLSANFPPSGFDVSLLLTTRQDSSMHGEDISDFCVVDILERGTSFVFLYSLALQDTLRLSTSPPTYTFLARELPSLITEGWKKCSWRWSTYSRTDSLPLTQT